MSISTAKGIGKGKGSIELPPGIQETIIKEPSAGAWKRPKTCDEVEVHLVGRVVGEQDARTVSDEIVTVDQVTSTAEPFLSTRSSPEAVPLKIVLGSGSAPAPGLDLAIRTMRQGQISCFTLAPEYAYGKADGMGCEDSVVPPGVSVSFEVELLSWTSREDLFGNGKIIKAIVTEGSGWQRPQLGIEVRLSYKAVREKDSSIIGEVVDDQYIIGSGCAKPARFALVLERALCLMKRGETCILTCEAGHAFDEGDGDVSVTLELHELCEVVDVSVQKDGSLLKKRLRQGEGNLRPKDGQRVTVCVESIAATLAASQVLAPDTHTRIEFVVGNGDVCDALEFLILDMQKDERASLTCNQPVLWADTGLAVDLGVSALVGESAEVVVFTVSLLDFEKGLDEHVMSEQEKVEFASNRKVAGNKLFKQKRWVLAIECYKRVAKILESAEGFREESRSDARDVKRSAELNKAACALHLGEWELAKLACGVVLKQDPRHVKALFRRGSAYVGLGDFPAAISDLKRCLEIDSTNADAKRVLQQAMRGRKVEDQQQRGIYSKMCEGLGKCDPAQNEKENAGPSSNLNQEESNVEVSKVAPSIPEPSKTEITSLDGKPIMPGMQVEITGLVSRTDLNGKQGRIVAWDTQERRWRVQLSTGQGICVKPSNMLLDQYGVSGDVKYGPPPPPQA